MNPRIDTTPPTSSPFTISPADGDHDRSHPVADDAIEERWDVLVAQMRSSPRLPPQSSRPARRITRIVTAVRSMIPAGATPSARAIETLPAPLRDRIR